MTAQQARPAVAAGALAFIVLATALASSGCLDPGAAEDATNMTWYWESVVPGDHFGYRVASAVGSHTDVEHHLVHVEALDQVQLGARTETALRISWTQPNEEVLRIWLGPDGGVLRADTTEAWDDAVATTSHIAPSEISLPPWLASLLIRPAIGVPGDASVFAIVTLPGAGASQQDPALADHVRRVAAEVLVERTDGLPARPGTHGTTVQTLQFDPQIPVPTHMGVRTDAVGASGIGLSTTWTARLLAYERGPAQSDMVTGGVAIERTSDGSGHPADGPRSPLQPALGEALEEALRSPPVATWLAATPDARLIGFWFDGARNGTPHPTWTFTWGAPPGGGYGAMVETQEDHLLVATFGSLETRPFEVDRLPKAPMTLETAAALWRSWSTWPLRDEAVTFVEWGWAWQARAATGQQPHAPPLQRADDLLHLAIGTESAGGASIRADGIIATGAQTRVVSQVTFDVEEAVPVSAWSAHFDRPPVQVGDIRALDQPDQPSRAQGTAKGATWTIEPISMAAKAVAAAAVAGLLTRLALVAGYAKLRADHVLRQPMRKRIFDIVQASPGIRAADITAAAGCRRRTTRHHLSVLHHADHVRRLRVGGRVTWCASDCPLEEAVQTAVLANPRRKDLMRLVERRPGLDAGELSIRLAVSRQAVRKHVIVLEQAGIVARVRDGRSVRHFATTPVAVTDAQRE